MSALNRSKTLPLVKSPQGVPHPELDLAGGNSRDFKYSGKTGKYTITTKDIGRPDRISQTIYENQNFWWILMSFNNVFDCWTDLYPGLVLKCPPKEVMEKWYGKAKKYAEQRTK